MRNFAIHFQYPWLLLLLIPAFALTIVLYLLLNKKYRRTRNRIVSIVLHCIVMVLCVFALAGITFNYDIANLENEIILLVDVSDTEARSAEQRDEFVAQVIAASAYDGYKVGVVTFGFDQHYAVPLTYDTNSIYNAYLGAEKPDISATDIAAALRFVSEEELFEHPETAKIVLITDGKQTDEDAISVIDVIARKGITVDTVCISSEYAEDNVQVMGVTYPDYHINQNEAFTLTVNLNCKDDAPQTTVQVYDNGVLAEGMSATVDLTAGERDVSFSTSFSTLGLHEISVKLTSGNDGLENNNSFTSYYFLEVFGRVLIIEHKSGESEAVKAMLEEKDAYRENVDILDLSSYDHLPTTVDELRAYDQIILNNIANADIKDLPVPETVTTEDGKDWFAKLLYSYVYDYGGGLLTVGGREGEEPDLTAHSYNRDDLYNTIYQEMLPVQAIKYTPPVAVMIIIDISGSMCSSSGSGESPLYFAKQGAIACLQALTERDYIGIMTLDTNYGVILPLTSRTEESRIRDAILSIGEGNETIYSSAIRTAGERLRQQGNVDKRHIVIVSDGYPGDKETEYLPIAEELNKTSGITLSFVGVGDGMKKGGAAYNAMDKLVKAGGGRLHPSSSDRDLIDEMRDDLNAPEIKEVKEEPFHPIVADTLSPLFNGVTYGTTTDNRREMDVTLGGFFGVKKRESAEVLLTGDYDVPIYAQWKYGKGMVGSFLCDLDGSERSWSREFMADPNGRQFLYNVIANLMPTENIRPGDIRLELKEENYINSLSVYTTLAKDERIEGKIVELTETGETVHSMNTAPEGEDKNIYVTSYLGESNRFSRCSFVIKRSGVYKIVVEKYAADGTLSSSVEIYKAFSYSEEYDSFSEEEEDAAALLTSIADRANGSLIAEDDPGGVFRRFITSLHRTYDPRLAFMIAAMILFLGDIAVRKFKFKWPHEIIREHKAKKADSK